MPSIDFRLYLVTDRHQTQGRPLLSVLARFIDAGGTAIQVRERDLDTGQLMALLQDVQCLARSAPMTVFINDRVDLATAMNTDGVHLRETVFTCAGRSRCRGFQSSHWSVRTLLAAGWYRRLSYAVEPFLAALNATPQVAFLPLIVVWVGTGLGARVLIIFLLAVLPIAINAHAAVRTTDPRLVKVAASFSAGDWRLFRTIILPGAVPFLLAGLRLAIGRGMIGVVVGEIYGSATGVGAMINQAGSRFQTDKVFVGVLTIVAIGVLLVEIVQRIERRVEVWRPPA